MAVLLRAVTDENRDEVLAPPGSTMQTRFVGTVAGALADAAEIPERKGWYRAVYAGDVPVVKSTRRRDHPDVEAELTPRTRR